MSCKVAFPRRPRSLLLKDAIYSSVYISEISPSSLRLVLNEFSLGFEELKNRVLLTHVPFRSKISNVELHVSWMQTEPF